MTGVGKKAGSILVVLLALSFNGHSQDLDIGVTAGTSYYLGDLNPARHFQNPGLAVGVMSRYSFDTRWAVRASAMYGKVQGDASSSAFLPDRGLTFESTVIDIGAVAEFNFIPYFTGSLRSGISPYIFAGISYFMFEPFSNGQSLRELGTEGQNVGYEGRQPYNLYSFSVPFGLGVKFSLAKNLGLQVYWEMHKTFTDYLDDVSTTYYLTYDPGGSEKYYYLTPDPTTQGKFLKVDLTHDQDIQNKYNTSDPTSAHTTGMQRGNSKNTDWFGFLAVTLTYKFTLLSSKKCRDLEHE